VDVMSCINYYLNFFISNPNESNIKIGILQNQHYHLCPLFIIKKNVKFNLLHIPYFHQTTPAEQTKIVTNCKISAFEELCFHADYDRCSVILLSWTFLYFGYL